MVRIDSHFVQMDRNKDRSLNFRTEPISFYHTTRWRIRRYIHRAAKFGENTYVYIQEKWKTYTLSRIDNAWVRSQSKYCEY